MKNYSDNNYFDKDWYTKDEVIEFATSLLKKNKNRIGHIVFSNKIALGKNFTSLILQSDIITIGLKIEDDEPRPRIRKIFSVEPMYTRAEMLTVGVAVLHEPNHLEDKKKSLDGDIHKWMVIKTASPSAYSYNYDRILFEVRAIKKSFEKFLLIMRDYYGISEQDCEMFVLEVYNKNLKEMIGSKEFSPPVTNDGIYQYDEYKKLIKDLTKREKECKEVHLFFPEPEFDNIPENDILNTIYEKYPRGKILNMTRKEFEDLILEEFALELRTSNFKNNKEIIEGIKEFHPDIAKQMKLDIEQERKNGKW